MLILETVTIWISLTSLCFLWQTHHNQRHIHAQLFTLLWSSASRLPHSSYMLQWCSGDPPSCYCRNPNTSCHGPVSDSGTGSFVLLFIPYLLAFQFMFTVLKARVQFNSFFLCFGDLYKSYYLGCNTMPLIFLNAASLLVLLFCQIAHQVAKQFLKKLCGWFHEKYDEDLWYKKVSWGQRGNVCRE